MVRNMVVYPFFVFCLLLPAAPSAQEQENPGPTSNETATASKPTDTHKAPALVLPGTDVVLLLDCSGKMKLIDPRDFRKPAAKLFISLLDEDDNVSIIGFGDTARELAPLVRNSRENREKLFSGVDNITSKEFNTNITEAIQKAYDKLKSSPRQERIVILLSDGTLDLGTPLKTEEAYKQLKQLLPQVAKAGIRIYCIAFTELARMELLEEVATQTNGTAVLAASDKDLHGIFASIFEKIKSPDSLPLRGDSFAIDRDVREAILLITKKAGTHTALTDPRKKVHTAKKHGKNIAWYETPAFDMVTLSTPEVGPWKVGLSSSEGNKVYVITDLKLKTSFARDSVERGEKITIDAWLEKQGVMVQKKELLEQAVFSAEVRKPDGNRVRFDLLNTGSAPGTEAKVGIYARILTIDAVGEYGLMIKAEGKTFQREKTLQFRAGEPSSEPPAMRVPTRTVIPPPEEQPEQFSWRPVLIKFGLINSILLFVGAGLYGVYRMKKGMLQHAKKSRPAVSSQEKKT